MDVGQPGHVPVGGKRQQAFWRRDALEFLVQANQPFAAQFDFRFQELKAGAELDQFHRQLDLPDLAEDAFGGHARASVSRGCSCRAAIRIDMWACWSVVSLPSPNTANIGCSSSRKLQSRKLDVANLTICVRDMLASKSANSRPTPSRYMAAARSCLASF